MYEHIMTFEETKAESIREMTVRLPQVAAIQRALTNYLAELKAEGITLRSMDEIKAIANET